MCMCERKYGQLNSTKFQIIFQGGAGADSEKIRQSSVNSCLSYPDLLEENQGVFISMPKSSIIQIQIGAYTAS